MNAADVDLLCDNAKLCGSWLNGTGDWVRDEAHARAKGWHIFHGYSETGKRIDVYLCSTCVGTPRSKLPDPPPRLDGQLDLF